MAVIQLSRIQVRRGQKNQGTGLPQLAGGEFGWAIDTQELYIGNGSLSEGAPNVGNTKILTASDNIFSLSAGYTYKETEPYIQTGSEASTPTGRSLQSRLDDQVSIKNFGVIADGVTPVGDDFQRAVDQLFINDATKVDPASRVILVVDAGHYLIERTIYIPPYATLLGAGQDKTIIEFQGTGPVFQTVNELSTPSNPSLDEVDIASATTVGNQPRNIRIADMTINQTGAGVGLHVSSCRDSVFENLLVKGPWDFAQAIPTITQGVLPEGTGILLDSLSPVVRTHNNKFYNCYIQGYGYGIVGNQKITDNIVDKCTFNTLGKGIVFGAQANGTEEIPKFNYIHNSSFTDIHSEGLKFMQGTRNQSQNNKFTLVGNYGGSEYLSVTPVIEFTAIGNESIDDYFARTDALRTEFTVASTYVAEVKGNVNHIQGYTDDVTIPTSGSPQNILRLPAEQNQSYELEYYLYNQSYDIQRTGKLIIACDKTGADKVHITDEYTQVGDDNYDSPESYLLYDIFFSAEFVNDGTPTEPVYSLYLKSKNTFAAPAYFRYKLTNHKINF